MDIKRTGDFFLSVQNTEKSIELKFFLKDENAVVLLKENDKFKFPRLSYKGIFDLNSFLEFKRFKGYKSVLEILQELCYLVENNKIVAKILPNRAVITFNLDGIYYKEFSLTLEKIENDIAEIIDDLGHFLTLLNKKTAKFEDFETKAQDKLKELNNINIKLEEKIEQLTQDKIQFETNYRVLNEENLKMKQSIKYLSCRIIILILKNSKLKSSQDSLLKEKEILIKEKNNLVDKLNRKFSQFYEWSEKNNPQIKNLLEQIALISQDCEKNKNLEKENKYNKFQIKELEKEIGKIKTEKEDIERELSKTKKKMGVLLFLLIAIIFYVLIF